jgi:serine/threonine protein kinase/phosphoenolpyruvate-protein kinase (PTS system EI component)/DNA-binding transcriptional regulator/RsmH inhibitor MraZ
MSQHYDIKIKSVALLLTFTFLLSEISYAAPSQVFQRPESPLQTLLNDPSRFEAPVEFCRFQETHKGSQDTLIIHIQDAHVNFSGQKNLAAALDALMAKYRVNLVLVEGGTRDDTLTPIKSVATPEVWKKVAKKFLMEGKISGEEYLNLTSDHPMKIMGIEDKELYMKSVRAYAELADKREAILGYLKTVQAAVAKLKNKLYPKELLEYEGLGSEFKEEKLKRLLKLAQMNASANQQLDPLPNIQKLIALQQREALINFNLANLEQAALLEEIAARGGELELKNHLERMNRMKNERLFQWAAFQNTLNIARKKNVDISKYPNLILYGETLKEFSSIDFDALLNENDKLENEVYFSRLTASAAKTPPDSSAGEHDSRLVRSIDRYLALLVTAYSIQMSTKEFGLFRANEPDFSTISYLAFVNRKLAELGYAEDLIVYNDSLEQGKKPLAAFYDSVAQRDLVFLKNTAKILESEKEKVAVLIAGGYHTPHLKKLLRENGYSYLVLTPHVSSETNQTKYERLLLEPVKKEVKTVRMAEGKKNHEVRPAAAVETGRLAELVTEGARLAGTSAEKAAGLMLEARVAARDLRLPTVSPDAGFLQGSLAEGPETRLRAKPVALEGAGARFAARPDESLEITRLWSDEIIVRGSDADGTFLKKLSGEVIADEWRGFPNIYRVRRGSGEPARIIKIPHPKEIRELEFLHELQQKNVPNVPRLLRYGFMNTGETWAEITTVDHSVSWEHFQFSNVAEFTRALIDTAETLNAVHAAGVVHNDVTPGNLVIGERNGQIQLIDFGISLRDKEEWAFSASGTQQFMAPEIDRTPASDVFGFGRVIDYILDNGGIYRKSGKKFAKSQFSELVKKMTETDPKDRWTLDQVIEELKRIEIRALVSGLLVEGKANVNFMTAEEKSSRVIFQRREAFESALALFLVFDNAKTQKEKEVLKSTALSIAGELDGGTPGEHSLATKRVAEAYWQEWHRDTGYREFGLISHYGVMLGKPLAQDNTWLVVGRHPARDGWEFSAKTQFGKKNEVTIVIKVPSFVAGDVERFGATALPNIGDETLPDGLEGDEAYGRVLVGNLKALERASALAALPIEFIEVELTKAMTDSLPSSQLQNQNRVDFLKNLGILREKVADARSKIRMRSEFQTPNLRGARLATQHGGPSLGAGGARLAESDRSEIIFKELTADRFLDLLKGVRRPNRDYGEKIWMSSYTLRLPSTGVPQYQVELNYQVSKADGKWMGKWFVDAESRGTLPKEILDPIERALRRFSEPVEEACDIGGGSYFIPSEYVKPLNPGEVDKIFEGYLGADFMPVNRRVVEYDALIRRPNLEGVNWIAADPAEVRKDLDGENGKYRAVSVFGVAQIVFSARVTPPAGARLTRTEVTRRGFLKGAVVSAAALAGGWWWLRRTENSLEELDEKDPAKIKRVLDGLVQEIGRESDFVLPKPSRRDVQRMWTDFQARPWAQVTVDDPALFKLATQLSGDEVFLTVNLDFLRKVSGAYRELSASDKQAAADVRSYLKSAFLNESVHFVSPEFMRRSLSLERQYLGIRGAAEDPAVRSQRLELARMALAVRLHRETLATIEKYEYLYRLGVIGRLDSLLARLKGKELRRDFEEMRFDLNTVKDARLLWNRDPRGVNNLKLAILHRFFLTPSFLKDGHGVPYLVDMLRLVIEAEEAEGRIEAAWSPDKLSVSLKQKSQQPFPFLFDPKYYGARFATKAPANLASAALLKQDAGARPATQPGGPSLGANGARLAGRIPTTGDQVGQWKIGRLISRGPISDVYDATFAEGSGNKPETVIKITRWPRAKSKVKRHHFEREVANYQALRKDPDYVHHFPEYFDSGSDYKIGYGWIVLQKTGIDLEVALSEIKKLKKKMPAEDPSLLKPTDVKWILIQLFDRLTFTASKKIHHLELKPCNILITNELHLFLVDLGSSYRVGEKLPEEFAVNKGYTAPEHRVFGQDVEGAATDIFSVGVMLYYFATGSNLFNSDHFPTYYDLHRTMPNETEIREHLPDIWKPYAAIIAKAITMPPSRRYQSAAEMKRDFLAVSDARAATKAPANLARAKSILIGAMLAIWPVSGKAAGIPEARAREIQTALQKAGYEIAVDGKIGPKSVKAIEDFQRRHNLKVNGIADPEFWKKIQETLVKPAVNEAPVTTLTITAYVPLREAVRSETISDVRLKRYFEVFEYLEEGYDKFGKILFAGKNRAEVTSFLAAVRANQIRNFFFDTGLRETGYTSSVQNAGGGRKGSAASYFQVEPPTANDAMIYSFNRKPREIREQLIGGLSAESQPLFRAYAEELGRKNLKAAEGRIKKLLEDRKDIALLMAYLVFERKLSMHKLEVPALDNIPLKVLVYKKTWAPADWAVVQNRALEDFFIAELLADIRDRSSKDPGQTVREFYANFNSHDRFDRLIYTELQRARNLVRQGSVAEAEAKIEKALGYLEAVKRDFAAGKMGNIKNAAERIAWAEHQAAQEASRIKAGIVRDRWPELDELRVLQSTGTEPGKILADWFMENNRTPRGVALVKTGGARLAEEIKIEGNDGTAPHKTVIGRVAEYDPVSIEEILYPIDPKELDSEIERFQDFVEKIGEAAALQLNGTRSPQDAEVIKTYLRQISTEITGDLILKREKKEVLSNPAALMLRRIERDRYRVKDVPNLTPMLNNILDLVRPQLLVLSKLVHYQDPAQPQPQELRRAERSAKRQLRQADEVVADMVSEYDMMIAAAEKQEKHTQDLVQALKKRNGELRKEMQELVKSRGILVANKVLGIPEQDELNRQINQIREISQTVKKNKETIKKLEGVQASSLFLQGPRAVPFEIKEKFLAKSKRKELAERMIRENRTLASIIYEEYLIKGKFRKRRTVPDTLRPMFDEMIDVTKEMIGTLVSAFGREAETHRLKMVDDTEDVILVVKDPINLGIMNRIWLKYGHRIRGIVTTQATLATHWVIVAQGYADPPAIVLLQDEKAGQFLKADLKAGDVVILSTSESAKQSVVIANPSDAVVKENEREREKERLLNRRLQKYVSEKTPFPLYANITPENTGGLHKSGADGVGLVRTEVFGQQVNILILKMLKKLTRRALLGTNGAQPSYELLAELVSEYGKIMRLSDLEGQNLTFRTWDLREDKNFKLFTGLSNYYKANQTSGIDPNRLEGFEFYKTVLGKDMLIQQIAALLVAYGSDHRAGKPKLRIMVPNVSGKEDLDFIQTDILPEAVRVAQLFMPADQKAEDILNSVTFGVMVETRGIIKDIDAVLTHPLAGFFSVGTNDFTSETLSDVFEGAVVSRDNPALGHLFSQFHPAVLKKLDELAGKISQYNTDHPDRAKELGFCGEIAGSGKFLLFILYLQRKYKIPVYSSMSPGKISLGKHTLRQVKSRANLSFFDKPHISRTDQQAESLAGRLLTQSRIFKQVVREIGQPASGTGARFATKAPADLASAAKQGAGARLAGEAAVIAAPVKTQFQGEINGRLYDSQVRLPEPFWINPNGTPIPLDGDVLHLDLPEPFIIFVETSHEKFHSIRVYPREVWNSKTAVLLDWSKTVPTGRRDSYKRLVGVGSKAIEIVRQRFTLPNDFMEKAGLKPNQAIVFVGKGEYFEIWPRAKYVSAGARMSRVPVPASAKNKEIEGLFKEAEKYSWGNKDLALNRIRKLWITIPDVENTKRKLNALISSRAKLLAGYQEKAKEFGIKPHELRGLNFLQIRRRIEREERKAMEKALRIAKSVSGSAGARPATQPGEPSLGAGGARLTAVRSAYEVFLKLAKKSELIGGVRSVGSDVNLAVAQMMDELGIRPDDHILSVGPGVFPAPLVAASLKLDQGRIDVVQPPVDVPKIGGPSISQTKFLEQFVEGQAKEIEKISGVGGISRRINIKTFQGFLQELELPRKHYRFAFLFNVFDTVPSDQKSAFLAALLASLEDDAVVLFSVFNGNENEFIRMVSEQGYQVEKAGEFYNTGSISGNTTLELKIHRLENAPSALLVDSLRSAGLKAKSPAELLEAPPVISFSPSNTEGTVEPFTKSAGARLIQSLVPIAQAREDRNTLLLLAQVALKVGPTVARDGAPRPFRFERGNALVRFLGGDRVELLSPEPLSLGTIAFDEGILDSARELNRRGLAVPAVSLVSKQISAESPAALEAYAESERLARFAARGYANAGISGERTVILRLTTDKALTPLEIGVCLNQMAKVRQIAGANVYLQFAAKRDKGFELYGPSENPAGLERRDYELIYMAEPGDAVLAQAQAEAAGFVAFESVGDAAILPFIAAGIFAVATARLSSATEWLIQLWRNLRKDPLVELDPQAFQAMKKVERMDLPRYLKLAIRRIARVDWSVFSDYEKLLRTVSTAA